MGKKRKRHVLTLPKTKFHAKNQKNLSRGFPGKWGKKDRQRDRQRDRDGPEYKGPPDAIAKPSDQQKFYYEQLSVVLEIVSARKIKIQYAFQKKNCQNYTE